MDFVALDSETANENLASICQVGAVNFQNGIPVTEYSSLANPEGEFASINISIHGIDKQHVKCAPLFPAIYPILRDMLSDRIVISHTPFDRSALQQAIARYELPQISCRWLDSARIVRRTWVECEKIGYGLGPTAERLGISFEHHDALADAKTAGLIMIHAIAKSRISLEDWLSKSLSPLGEKTAREGNPAGSLYGECLVFTGALEIPRREAATLASHVGCMIVDNVSKKVSILVVGDQDIRKTGCSSGKSRKHRFAEKLIDEGAKIRIIGETDFLTLCKNK